ncbi:camp-dependent protein kinase regulatory subunit [Metschnikowia bicuspidata var. bicuspidata NRRL YB-4993]|uniref:cAMP-dependent protein kinase regulatory subunit n=1 Tax=Metschnikowia bicuspidata var. bicuspidata NRRL YB-4993 TaxID=869754 RepID=A0A1A0H7X9_9ASCO|nr:camp-dependent protein kinase regulatory subunit [Metschnikowia bicuspidata var. bicuspidata NRRL YB-4993]OBA20090.1 camp-dependent protein kinase regulatory subunit [Metschnikowia bicuspidata var. bicuspidata NRRL YB-4993]
MSSYQFEELNQLQREIIAENPADILQFSANFFSNKLALQRAHAWQSQARAKAAGIELFPNTSSVSPGIMGSFKTPTFRQPSFKSPFDDNDPHSDHAKDHHDDGSSKKNESVGGLFKNNFGQSLGSKESVHPETDPAESSAGDKSETKPINKLPRTFNANRRVSVSAEAMNPDEFKSDSWKPPVNDLNPQQRGELGKTLSLNFLFQQLDSNSKSTVLSALIKKNFLKETEIIKQGEVGDYFYIIESGVVDFYVNGSKVNTSGDGSSFGELALMYNSPRAATAVAASDVTCWALDRATFRRILLEGTFNRRIMYEDFLKDVKVLLGLTSQERSKLASALSTEIYSAGEEIVTEGEVGEKFYLIESGTCVISKKGEGVIGEIGKGKYFGEVALLNDLPRQATVTAANNVIVATLGKSGFTRLLGPALDVLRKQDPTAN